MGTSRWHCQGLEEAKSTAFTFIHRVLVFSDQPAQSFARLKSNPSLRRRFMSNSIFQRRWRGRSGSNRPPAKPCDASQDRKSVFYRGEKSVALFKSTLGSADERPGPHSLVTAVLLKWVVMRTVRFNRNVIYSCVLSLFPRPCSLLEDL